MFTAQICTELQLWVFEFLMFFVFAWFFGFLQSKPLNFNLIWKFNVWELDFMNTQNQKPPKFVHSHLKFLEQSLQLELCNSNSNSNITNYNFQLTTSNFQLTTHNLQLNFEVHNPKNILNVKFVIKSYKIAQIVTHALDCTHPQSQRSKNVAANQK